MFKYFNVWKRLTLNSFQTVFLSRTGALLFMFGKIVRFVLFLSFLVILVTKTHALSGYRLEEVLLFFLTFNLIDVTTQTVFREVYRFRQHIVSGNFDVLLAKPVNVLFRSLFGGADAIDLLTIIPILSLILFVILRIPGVSWWGVLGYIGSIAIALVIAAAFHIMVLSLAILTTEIDHAIMIYRDITGMGKLPIDIYAEPLRSFLTFFLPVGIMMSFPVYALIGTLGWLMFFYGFLVSFMLLISSLFLWQHAIRRYTSFTS